MDKVRTRGSLYAALFLMINTAGLCWIHHDLTASSNLEEKGPETRVLWALPENEVDLADRFSLVLDTGLAPAGRIGEPLVRSPFKITPDPGGQWIWAAADRIEFLPEAPLTGGQRFVIKPVADFQLLTSRRLVGESAFVFQTAPLEVVACRLGPYRRDKLSLELTFNQAVDPHALYRHLKVCLPVSRRSLDTQLVSRGPGRTLEFSLQRPDGDHLEVQIDECLTCEGGSRPLGEDYSKVLRIHSLFAYMRNYVSAPSLTRAAKVRLYFSRELEAEQELSGWSIVPEVDNLALCMDDEALCLTGDFEPGSTYICRVPGTLLAEGGEALGEEQNVSFEIPRFKPQMRFPLDRGVLTPQGQLDLELEAVGIAGLEVDAYKVHANNLVAHLRGERLGSVARKIKSGLEIPLEGFLDQPGMVALDLGGLLDDPRGIYSIRAEAAGSRWIADTAMVTVSDLALTAKRGRGELLLWVTSLRTGTPLCEVEVAAVTYNNQTVAAGRTDPDGLARIRLPAGQPDGPPWLVVAQKDEDLNYLRFDEHRWVFDELDLSGKKIPETYDIMLYGERGVYRPGEEIHLTGIIRDRDGDVPEPFPLEITQTRPDGKEVIRRIITPEEGLQGVFHGDFSTWDKGQTGIYRFTATLPGSGEVLGRTEVFVEAFEPQRLELTADLSKPRYLGEESPEISLAARYLFDQPCAGLPAVVYGDFKPVRFESRAFPEYRFADGLEPGASQSVAVPQVDMELDEEGRATLRMDLRSLDRPLLWRGALFATVTEPGGRSLSRRLAPLVDRAERHIGLCLDKGALKAAGVPFSVDWVARTREDGPASAREVGFRLYRLDYDTHLQKVNDRYVWKSTERLVSLWGEEMLPSTPDAARGAIQILCPGPGKHRLVAKDLRTGVETRVDFYAADGGDGAQSLCMNRPERLEIVCDQERYAPGSTAKLLVRSPFPGTMLVTVETDRVVHSVVAPVIRNSAQILLPVSNQLRGGAFVTATLVRAVEPGERSWLPHRALGLARLRIDHTGRRLPLTLEVPKKVRPGQTITVNLETKVFGGFEPGVKPSDGFTPGSKPSKPAVVHLFAVDEGVLLTSGYETPDPLGYFLAEPAAVVESFDLFGRLLPDYQRPRSMARIGAGGSREDKETARRSSVSPRKRAAALVWGTAAPVGVDGRLSLTCTLPELVGELRWMAVAVRGDAYGFAEAASTLATPLLAEVSWPRFAAPGDTFRIPLKLFNTTGHDLVADLSLEIDGPWEAVLEEPRIRLAPGLPQTQWLSGRALGIGPVTVTTRARAGSEEATHRAEFMVRPASPLHSESSILALDAGASLALGLPETFLPGTAEMTVSLSARPDVQLRPAVDELIRYPYGCVEQTTSRCRALLCAPQLLREEERNRQELVKQMIYQGLDRLSSMQTRSGGLAYWPGGYEPCLWGTAYAARFLADVRQAGYAVQDSFLKGVARYLKKELDSERDRHDEDPDLQAQICWVLADLDNPQPGWMARLSQQAGTLGRLGRAYLAAAWIAAGRKDRAQALLADEDLARLLSPSSAGSFRSAARSCGTLLRTLVDLDPRHPAIPTLVAQLEKSRTNGAWGSTLNNAVALSALLRYQNALADEEVRFQGNLRGKGEEGLAFDHTRARTCSFRDLAEPLCLSTSGTGTVYLSCTVEGLAREGSLPDADRGLEVRRIWKDRDGKPIGPQSRLRVGDLVLVDLTLRALVERGERVEHVAVVDALPGGLEVENPRLVTSAVPGRPAGDRAERVEFLDDRVVLFATATREPKTFKYALRVTSAGRFTFPRVQASCMYDPAFASIHGSREKLEVSL